MKKTIFILIAGLLFLGVNVYAQQNDVFIDENGNVITGNSNINGGNLEVLGASGEDGIVGITSGTGKSGVYGESTDSGYGVQGLSDTGIGGYFNSNSGYGLIVGNGNVGIGNPTPLYSLDVGGTINASSIKISGVDVLTSYTETDPLYSGDPAFGITSELISDWNTAYGWGNHASKGYDTTNDSWTGTGDVYTTSGNVGIGTSSFTSKLTVDGTIESITGGFKFPDGSTQITAVGEYAGLAVVAKSGGDYIDPVTAMNAVASWCGGVPSPTHPCLLKIMPGEYDIGSASVQMQPYVDIEGSGENVTTISGSLESSSAGTINGADNAEIRFITVQNNSVQAIAIYNNSASPSISNITTSSDGKEYSDYYGIYNISSSPTIHNVRIIDPQGYDGTGIYNDTSSPFISNVIISIKAEWFSNGIVNKNNSNPDILSVVITSEGNYSKGIENLNNSSPRMKDLMITSYGITMNKGVRNQASSPSMTNINITTRYGEEGQYGVDNADSSPTMTNITVTATGGVPIAVKNYNSSPTMTNITATATLGWIAWGVYNNGGSPIMTNVIATASEGIDENYGVYNIATSLTMTNVTATATGTSGNDYGVYNTSSSTSNINHSVITGTTNSINTDSTSTIQVGNSQLNGTAGGSGTKKCIGAYDSNYNALNSSCL